MQQKSSSSIKLYGFGILRNGVKYDYSFLESLNSLKPIVEKVYMALDDGEDSTRQVLESLDFVKIIPSKWDMTLKKGLVLSVETNVALNALRKDIATDSAFGIYLQSDEILHEDDYELLKRDIEIANREGFDAISFRYLHFWQTHHDIAISKKWYPQEIRCVKLNSEIESWGDAQGFRNYKKVFNTEARIFHYGHVRELESYKSKMNDMGLMYHDALELNKKLAKGFKEAKKNKCIDFFGRHPSVMKERILRMNDIWELPRIPEVYIVGTIQEFSKTIVHQINADKVHWVNSLNEVPKKFRKMAVITNPTIWDYLFKRSKVPMKMHSKIARNWSKDFRFILQLSEKKVGLKAN